MSSVLVDTGTLVELHFLVDELNRNPSNVAALALRLKELLNPYNKVSTISLSNVLRDSRFSTRMS